MPKVADQVLMFVPDTWGEVDWFLNFYQGTYAFSDRDRRAISGVYGHFHKACLLVGLATKLGPNLSQDNAELEERGFTAAINAKEIVAVIEASILEMYSTVDCTVKVLRAVYGPGSRGFKDSTRKFFQSYSKIEGSFPESLKKVVAGAVWYPRLLRLRDELTHLATGHLQTDMETGLARYSHFGMREGEGSLSIPDVFEWLNDTLKLINTFTGATFRELNLTLEDKEMFQPCGMVEGRILWRYVSPRRVPITFDSGRCGAWTWFERDDAPSCPFVTRCGAYRRKAPAPVGAPPAILETPEAT